MSTKKIATLSKEIEHEIIRVLNIIQGIDEIPQKKMCYYESRRFDGDTPLLVLAAENYRRPSKSCVWR